MRPFNLNREYVKLWLEKADMPADFCDRFEMQQHATQLAEAHLNKTNDVMPSTTRGNLKHMLLRALHPLVHEWVKVLVYDAATDRIIDPGRGRVVCRNCPKS